MKLNKMIRPLAYLTALVMIAASVMLFWPEDKKDDTYQVTAYFEKAIGLFPNSDVNILGVPVGKVQEVEPVGKRVKVTMEVSKEYKVPADAQAQIVPISVISDRFVELFPAYEGGPVMQDGTVLNEDRTQIPAELDDVFKQLKKLLDAIQPGGPGEPGALGDLIVELDRAISGQEDNLQGALTEGSRLTRTLATTGDDLKAVLANLDSLFNQLATRSGDFDELNQNLIIVLSAIAESRSDLEGTLVNLGDLSAEVTDVVQDEGNLLEDDLRRLVKIARTVLKNERGVRQSLSWLPVLGWGLRNAFNPDPVNAVDVRDNATSKVECEILDTIPKEDLLEEIRKLLEELCAEQVEGPGGGTPELPPLPDPPVPTAPDEPKLDISCSDGVRRVKRQLRRVDQLGLPDEVKEELLDPLRKRLKKLAKECDEIAKELEDPGSILDKLLENVPDVGDVPGVRNSVDGLNGNAAGSAPAPVTPTEEESADDKNWFERFAGFLGL